MKKIFLILLFSICLIASPVLSLEIIPNELDVVITPNEYVIATILILNTEDHTLNISCSSSLNILFSPSSFSLAPEATQNLKIYIFEVANQEGNININYSEGEIDIPITITVNNTIINNNGINITIFPSSPLSGKVFAVFLDAPVDTSGFLWINEQMYPVEIKNGFTSLKTEENIYGDACLWLYGEGFTQDFEIKCGLEGTPIFKVSEPVTIGDIANIQLLLGDDPAANLDVFLKDPDDIEYQFKTDINGKIYPSLDKIGEWVLGSTFKGEQIIKKFTVTYKLLGLIVDKGIYNIGDTVIITCEEQMAEITIKRNKIMQLQTTTLTGHYEFVPEKSGEYTIGAISSEKKGTTSFIVNMPTSIRILDSNNMETTILKENNNYIIQILDENGQLVTGYTQVFTPIGPVYLNDGLGLWKPTTGGTVTLSIEDSGEYIGSELTVSIESEPDNSLVMMIFAIIIISFVVYILYRFFIKTGKIALPKGKGRKKLPNPDQIL